MTIVCANCGTENPDEARFCLNCGSSLAAEATPEIDPRLSSLRQSAPLELQEKLRAAGGSVEGERKPVTILFADIVGSTSIAEKLDPEEWKEVVAGAHQRLGEAIYRYEGTIAQLLGDGVLAFFGAPITHEDDPIRAVRAALDIQESVKTYRQELEGFVDDFRMRIGINTGTVVIGDVGSDLHVEYLAIGDAVNVAARLESAAEPGTVLISESSARLIGDDFEVEDRGEISVKGKSESLHVFEVVKTTGIPELRRGLPGEPTRYVGRARELETLRSKLQSLREGQGQIVAVLGEPGIGKTRLLNEVRTSFEEDEDSDSSATRWLEGRALSYGMSLSFWSISQLILSDLGLSDGAPEVKIKVALRKRVEGLFGEETSETFPYLAHLLGLAEVQDQLSSLDGETVKRQTLVALTEYIRRLAEIRPTVLILEDLHWADPSSLEALGRLLPLTERVALMILMPMRIEREHGSWRLRLDAETDFSQRFTELHLKRLTDDQADQLVLDLLGMEQTAEEIQQLVRSRAEGNPLYLEEVVHHLRERGLIERVDGSWRATQAIEASGVPDTLEGVLLARIDRLETEVRNTLQLASVVGKVFLYRILQAISEAERELEWHLTQLQRLDLVREKARHPELEYMFKHALTQEAAYNSLLHERRKEFHAKVGEALERLFADREEEFLGLLAHHFDAAEVYEKALQYVLRAGDKARLEDALEEALAYYERALELHASVDDLEGEANTWLKISLVHLKDFNFEAAHEAHEAAFGLQQTLKPERMVKTEVAAQQEVILRVAVVAEGGPLAVRLDPSKLSHIADEQAVRDCFAGLTEVDEEMNVVPHVARSWEVLDGGTRYVFHLRDDVFWTDREQVTAEDFKSSWLRNLSPGTETIAAPFLDVVAGAREYREGRTSDPDSVGVLALDPFTLEVTLSAPVPYFIYLTAFSVTFPVPRHVVERHGEAWSQVEHIVSNGPYRVRELDEEGEVWIRNPAYFGDFPGNVQRSEHFFFPNYTSGFKAYSEGKVDVLRDMSLRKRPVDLLAEIPRDEIGHLAYSYSGQYLVFNPLHPPLDDIRLRRALAHAVDRGPESEGGLRRGTLGGIVPKGMPGHSPGIGLRYDLSKAAQCFGDAGYPGGDGLPRLELAGIFLFQFQEFMQQWKDGFGITLETVELSPTDYHLEPLETHINAMPWVADYPDPDNFLRASAIHDFLVATGWEGIAHCDDLLDEALHSQDRVKRLEIYRQVDRLLVEEEALVVPLKYGVGSSLVKPWVHGMRADAMGYFRRKEISIEPHEATE